jgi:hypothetical protein
MEIIKVKKKRLLKTLRKNRKVHRQMFLDAQEVYREEVIKLLDSRLQRAREGGKIDMAFRLPEPQDYTESYDTAISMVDWAEGDTIDLDERSFEQYVLNKWGWQGAFAANTASYLAS